MKKITNTIFAVMMTIIMVLILLSGEYEGAALFFYFGLIAYGAFYIKTQWIRLMMIALFLISMGYVTYLKWFFP